MHDFVGRWRITWMEMWDQEFIDLVEPGYFLFDKNSCGEFIFGAVTGALDLRVTRYPELDYSWQGDDEGRPVCGRGDFQFPDPYHGEGVIYIHDGDESAIKIKRES